MYIKNVYSICLFEYQKRNLQKNMLVLFSINIQTKTDVFLSLELVFPLRPWSAVLMNQLMTFALLANILMWLGFRVKPATPIFGGGRLEMSQEFCR